MSASHHRRGTAPSNRQPASVLTALPQFPPAPAVPKPFVGRTRLLTRALEYLAHQSVVGITGVAGCGKSALAAAIAQRRAQPTIWITLSEGANESVDELLWQFARPLSASEPELTATLGRMRQEGYAALVRLQIILAAYARQPTEVLVCIDQIERAPGSVLHSLLIGLCDYVALAANTKIALIVAGRSLPYRLRTYALPSLKGLEQSDIQTWAATLGLKLSPVEIEHIARQTGGLPLALHALRTVLSEASGQIPLDRIMTIREVRQLVISMLGMLPIEQQRTLADLAARPDHYTSLSFEMLPMIEALEQQHLVTIAPQAILLHPFFGNYYHQLLR